MRARHPAPGSRPSIAKIACSSILGDAIWVARDAAAIVRDALSHVATWKFFALLSIWVAVAFSLTACGPSELKDSPRTAVLRFATDGAVSARTDARTAQTPRSVESIAVAPVLLHAADRDLLAQEALAAGLDRNLDVAEAVERARRQILARAWIDRTAALMPAVDSREILEFYEDNPALFARRRVYRVLEIAVAMAPERVGELQDAVVGARDLAAIVRWLDVRQLPFDATIFSRTTEQMPADVLRRASRMRDGEISVFPTPEGAAVTWLVQSAQAPLTPMQAKASIARYLLDSQRADLTLTEVARLREKVNAGWEGEIAPARRQLVAQADPPAPRVPPDLGW